MGDNLKDIVDACTDMTLNSTGGNSIGLVLLIKKLVDYQQSRYQKSSEDAINKHISKCKQVMKENNEGKWYIPYCMGDNQSTYRFVSRIRDLESGDYGYWKVQAFADAGVDLSKWDQSINVDIKDKEKDKKTAPMRKGAKAVKSKEKKKVVTKKT